MSKDKYNKKDLARFKKEIQKTKDHICYGIDKVDQLHYAKGRLAALEAVLQDLKDLQNREDSIDDIDQT